MIKNIFIPESIGSYYIFPKRIIGIDIQHTEIYATVVTAKGNARTIERLVEERIETDSNLSHQERLIKALQALHQKLGAYDFVYLAFPSSSAIFKELTLPFTGLKKIKQVVPFEVEALLPFSIDQAVIDTIVTKEDREKQTTEVLVAATKKENIAEYLSIFESAGFTVEKITIDMFELYGFYKALPGYHVGTETVALIELGFYTTRMALITEGQLKYIRALPKGLVTVAKKLHALNHIDTAINLESIIRFGINKADDPELSKNIKEQLEELLHELNFTITSYTKKLKEHNQLNQVFLTGAGADIPGILDLVNNMMAAKSHILQAKKMVHNGTVFSKVKTIPNVFLVSIATALSSELTEDFNLQQIQVNKEQEKVLNYRIIAVGVLSLLLLFCFATYSFFKIRNLRNAKKEAETEAITELNKVFKLKPSQTTTLEAANKAANNELRKQETAWQRLSNENRYAFLKYLSELSKCINLKESQLSLTSLSIKDDIIKLYGSVPGYEQLTKLQNQLECPLFKKLPKLQDLNFKSEPITLVVNKEEI